MKSTGLVLGGLLILAVNGCGGNPQEGGGFSSKPPIPKPAKPLAQGPAPLSGPAGAASVSGPDEKPFNPEGAPDPFQPPAEQLSGGIKGRAGALPLEQFEIGDYQLVGIVTGADIKKAVIQDLTGKGYFVVVGTRIGKGGGKIIKITDKEVLISEPYRDFTGRKKSRRIALKIPASL